MPGSDDGVSPMITEWPSTDDEERQATRDRWTSKKALRAKSAKTPVIMTVPGSVEYELSTGSKRKVSPTLGKKPSLFSAKVAEATESGSSTLPAFVTSQRSMDIEIPASWPDSVLLDVQKNNLNLWLREQRKMTRMHKEYMKLCSEVPEGQSERAYHRDLNKAYLLDYKELVNNLQTEYKRTLSSLEERGAVFPNGDKSHAGTVLPTKVGKVTAKDKAWCQRFMCDYAIHNLQEFMVISQKLKMRGNNALAQQLAHCASNGMFCIGEHKQQTCQTLKRVRDAASYIQRTDVEESWANNDCDFIFPHTGYESFKPVALPQVQFPPAALSCGTTELLPKAKASRRTYRAPVIVRGIQDDARQMCKRIMKKYAVFPGITEGYLAINPENPEYFRPTQAWDVLGCATDVITQQEAAAAHSRACVQVDRDRLAGVLSKEAAKHKKTQILRCHANPYIVKEWPIAAKWQQALKDDMRYTQDVASMGSLDAAPSAQEIQIAGLSKQIEDRGRHVQEYRDTVKTSVRARDRTTRLMHQMEEMRAVHAGEPGMPSDEEFYTKLHHLLQLECTPVGGNAPFAKLSRAQQAAFGKGTYRKAGRTRSIGLDAYDRALGDTQTKPSGYAGKLDTMQRQYCHLAQRSERAANVSARMQATYPFDGGDTRIAGAMQESLKRMVVPRDMPRVVMDDILSAPKMSPSQQCESYRQKYGIIPRIDSDLPMGGSWPGVDTFFPDADIPDDARLGWVASDCDKFYTTVGSTFDSVRKSIATVCTDMLVKRELDPESQAWTLQHCGRGISAQTRQQICAHRRDELKASLAANRGLESEYPWKLITYWHLGCPDTFISDLDAKVRCVSLAEVRRKARSRPEAVSLHKIWSQHKCNEVMAEVAARGTAEAKLQMQREAANDVTDRIEQQYQTNIASTPTTVRKKSWTDALMMLPYLDPLSTGDIQSSGLLVTDPWSAI